ncbi:MAG: CCA tRNA nucleotidyltransferase [Faecalibacterium sp.]|nr:CCA tRNA nucleotidyltransferase [Faecalibacterium sp.]
MTIVIPEKPAAALAQLRHAGIRAWAVGGAVRDSLLGRPAEDWDLTAACMPGQLAAALPEAKPIGGAYGTVSWHGVEITPCRAEAGYTDHRHPDSVCFGGSLETDLARRDFTVNAMAWDGEALTDPYHGAADLAARRLRCVGAPEVRFGEDALRILRLFRFAGTLDFDIDEPTRAAALALAPSLATVSAERVRGELNKAMKGERPSRLGPLLAAGGLEAFGLAGKRLAAQAQETAGTKEAAETVKAAGFSGAQLKMPAPADLLAPLDAVPQSLLCRWWALIHLTGSDAHKCAEAFCFGRSFCKDFARLDDWFDAGCPQDVHALKLALLAPVPFSAADAAETFAAISPAFAPLPALYAALRKSGEPYQKEQLAITAPELMVEGVPGRCIGRVQQCLLKAVIDTPEMNNYPTLAQMARSLKHMV